MESEESSDSVSSTSDNSTNDTVGNANTMTINRNEKYNLLLTNARSLSPKILSLHSCFEEHDLDFALITESWLKDGTTLDRDIIDLEHGSHLKIIYKNRPRNPVGRRKVGGGVSIIFNKSRCNLRERRIQGNKYELVMAVGRVGKLSRQVAIFCIYLEPRLRVAEIADINELISAEILKLKTNGDPMIFIGGDLNRKSLEDAVHDFPDIRRVNHDPTRGEACLDILYSNASNLIPDTWPPLETPAGVKSDHLCIVFSGTQPKDRDFVWIRKKARVHTDAAVTEFGRRLAAADWDAIMPPELGLDGMVKSFQKWGDEQTDELFPFKTSRRRSNEKPWITGGIRKLSSQKKRVFKREGKSALWRNLCTRMEGLLEASKSAFVDNAASAGHTSRQYFKAVDSLSKDAASSDWTLTDLFPGQTDDQAAEEAAGYFTRITDLFVPLVPTDRPPVATRPPITVEEVARRLKLAKKPNSLVPGDLLPRVVKSHHQLLAVPATKIFNAAFAAGKWPASWKNETTVVIPKVPNPESLGDCRNISCTPFLSKVMEGVLLDDLRESIPPDVLQYGGIKKCSVDHLLVDLFEGILCPMEGGASSLILGLDYERAFNRLDHGECLAQLRHLGATQASVELVASFLTGRTMQVRICHLLSTHHALNGGSPQGSILGCFLYCAATQQINLGLRNLGPQPVRTPPPAPPSEGSQPPTPPDEAHGMELIQLHAPPFDDSSDDSFHSARSSATPPPAPSPQAAGPEPALLMVKYVDDTTIIETVPRESAIRHVSAANPTEFIPANALTPLLENIIRRTEEIGMKVNCKKTQLLCLTPDNGYTPWSSITTPDGDIQSSDCMKLLGFLLGTAPGVSDHFEFLRKKFRARFWRLIHLRRAGMRHLQLYKIYAVLVRPVLEANCVIFHPMLTVTQSLALERMQKQVFRLCFGTALSYDALREEHNLETLAARRENAVRRFVAKTLVNPRFADRWFIRREEVDANLRRRRPYIEKRARTERYQKSPLVYMQKIANDMSV